MISNAAIAKAPSKMQKAKEFLIERFVPGITAVAKMGRGNFIQSLSNLVQRQRKEGWLHAFLIEWDQLCESGKIQEAYMDSDQAQECRQELLDSLDNDKPDQKKFEAMKKIFLRAAMATETEWQSNAPQQLMKICRTLTSEELTILGVAYRLYSSMSQGDVERVSRASERWPVTIAENSKGLITEGVVYFYENDLVEKQLIGSRTASDKSGVQYAHKCRLSPLGIELCAFLDA